MAPTKRELTPMAYLVCRTPMTCWPFRSRRKARAKTKATDMVADPEKQGGRCFICGQPSTDMVSVEFVYPSRA